MNTVIIIYAIGINLVGFLLMDIEKGRAKLGQWRIRERTLFLVALLGGSVGSLTGMFLFRHKTKHFSFLVGMPAILLIQIALLARFVW